MSAIPFMTSSIGQATIESIGVIDAGPAVSSAGAYGPFTMSTMLNPIAFGGSIDAFGLMVSFMASGGGDQYSFVARHEITTPVPEPSALLLSAAACSALSGSMCVDGASSS